MINRMTAAKIITAGARNQRKKGPFQYGKHAHMLDNASKCDCTESCILLLPTSGQEPVDARVQKSTLCASQHCCKPKVPTNTSY
jgi:hypothetical protein